jgi:hypothetical protein
MGLIILLVLLAVSSTYTMWQPTGLDFLRVEALRFSTPFGLTILKVTDMLTGFGILGVVALTRGPLMVASAAMFVLWAMTLIGVSKVAGLDVSPLIVYVIVVGGVVHIVTYKDH